MTKIGRNDPCICGSGKKFKKCCLGKVEIEPSKPNFFEHRLPVSKGIVSPMRSVPEHIQKPSYAVGGTPLGARARTCVKTADEIQRMRVAGRTARLALDTVFAAVRPGITTEALDIAHENAVELGAHRVR